MVDKTRDKIIWKKDAAIDKFIPRFDSYTPDTRFNRKRFAAFFGFAPTDDVSIIYCFNDQIGIDSKFLFSFKCNKATRDRIVRHLGLVQSGKIDNVSSGLWPHFPWWDSARIITLHPYWRKEEHEYYKYLWFDDDRQMLYYIDFDL